MLLQGAMRWLDTVHTFDLQPLERKTAASNTTDPKYVEQFPVFPKSRLSSAECLLFQPPLQLLKASSQKAFCLKILGFPKKQWACILKYTSVLPYETSNTSLRVLRSARPTAQKRPLGS